MPKKKVQKDYGQATLARVKREMAKPRVAKSARKEYTNLAVPVAWIQGKKPSSRELAGSQLAGELLKQ